MLYELLTAPALGFRMDYNANEQKVFVSILKKGADRDLGFWIDCPRNQIQTFDLQESLGGKGYLGVGLPLLGRIHKEFTSDTVGNQRQEYPDDFFEKQIVNDWLLFHLRGGKVHRQSFVLQGKSTLSPARGLQLERNLSTAQWMSASSVGA
jgi:hypothetical protein